MEKEIEKRHEEAMMVVSTPTSAARHTVTCANVIRSASLTILWLPPSSTPLCLYTVICLWTSTHVAWYQSPAARYKPTNVKHRTHRHTSYVHSGHAWPSPSSPEAEHEKGYLCSLKDPRQLSAHAFTAGLMKLVRPHNTAFSASRADLNAADRKPEVKKKKKKKAIGFHKDLQLTVRALTVVVACITLTCKPEHKLRARCPSACTGTETSR